jgi:nicotinic acid mononucleotide adenylyltransferase
MLRNFDLLVAARTGEFTPAPEFAHAVQSLALCGEFDHVSATEVRSRIACGEPWEHLVPKAVRELAREIYR